VVQTPGLPSSLPAGGGTKLSSCTWNATNGTLGVQLAIYPNQDGAQGSYEGAGQAIRSVPGMTFNGSQPVTGLGQQATAVFQTWPGSSPAVVVYTWSGNAEIQASFVNEPFGTQASRSAMLAADTAIARDVLAGLSRS